MLTPPSTKNRATPAWLVSGELRFQLRYEISYVEKHAFYDVLSRGCYDNPCSHNVNTQDTTSSSSKYVDLGSYVQRHRCGEETHETLASY
mmetsp:Transcript_26503/g.43450  ORF Transcript_26503/g.43450 Transcript_26503/m.43450 type:complete len:90 (+) Transcript_26503:699-968(+)